jgi:Uma2 family endonuclease
MTNKTLLTAEGLLCLPDDGRWYELVDGELVEVTPPGGAHNNVMGNVYYVLRNHVQPRDLGTVLPGDTGVILTRGPDTVRGPDVCFSSRERMPAGSIPAGCLEVAPDLVVEVVSPSDRAGNIDEKVQAWLRAGVVLVCVIDPQTRSLVLHRGSRASHRYQINDVVEFAPVLPDLRVPMSEFFG